MVLLLWSQLVEVHSFQSLQHLSHSHQGCWINWGSGLSLKLFLLLLKQKQLLLLLFLLLRSSFLKPLRISFDAIKRNFLGNTALISIVFPLLELLFIHLLIKSMHLSHFLDLIEVHDKAPFICVVFLDALPTKDS